MNASSVSPLKIGILRSSSIGDVVLATACLDLLAHLEIPIEIVWIGKSPAMDLVREAYPQIHFFEVKKGVPVKTLVDQIKDVHLLVDLQVNLRSRIIGQSFKKTTRRPVFICPKSQFQRNRLLLEARVYGRRRSLPSRAKEAIKHQHKVMSDVVAEGLKNFLPKPLHQNLIRYRAFPRLPTGHDHQSRPWLKELQTGLWLGVAPGASFETKEAPTKVFADIIRSTIAKVEAKGQALSIFFLGDSKDNAATLRVMDALCYSGRIFNLCGRLSLWETTLALTNAKVLLCNDSSLGHIAEAVRTPAAVLFGPTVEGFGFSTWMESSRSFSTTLGCRPCSKHGKATCRYQDKLCFTGLDKEEIASHLSNLIVEDRTHPESVSSNVQATLS